MTVQSPNTCHVPRWQIAVTITSTKDAVVVFDYGLDTSEGVPPTYCQRKYELKAVLDKVYYRSKGWKRV